MNKVFVQKNKLSYKSIIKEIAQIALPIAFQSFLIALLQLVDNLFIGRLAQAEYVAAGVNAINNITFIITTIVTGFIGGIGIYFTQVSVEKNIEKQHDIFKMKVIWMLIISGVLLTIFLSLLKHVSSLWISDDVKKSNSLNFAYQYGLIVLPSLFLDFIILVFVNSFKEIRLVKVTVFISILGLIINSVLNYFLMYYLGWGLSGSAYATLIARVFQCVVWFIYISITKPIFIPKFRNFFSIKISKIFLVFYKSFLWMVSGFLVSLAFIIRIMFISRISIQSGTSLNSAGVFLQLSQAFSGGFSQATNIMIVSFLAFKQQKHFFEYVNKNILMSFIFGIACGALLASITPIFPLVYPKYSNHANNQSIIMIFAVAATIWTNLVIGIWIAALKGSGFSNSLLIFDGLFSYAITLPLVLILYFTRQQTQLSYGWIYAIPSFSIFLKPLGIWLLYNWNKHKLKPLVLDLNNKSKRGANG